MVALTAIPGVGRKIAERLVVELRDRIGDISSPSPLLVGATVQQSHVRSEALLALTSLGYNKAAAEKAIRAAVQESPTSDSTVEALLKASLRYASK
jgi:Holliday junction DNA helicase RuvA